MKSILLLLILLLPSAFAQSGGGGSPVQMKFTFEQCNELLDDRIEKYGQSSQQARQAELLSNHRAKILGWIISVLFFVAIGYMFISLGMAIQKIKDKGFKEWLKGKWR